MAAVLCFVPELSCITYSSLDLKFRTGESSYRYYRLYNFILGFPEPPLVDS